MHRKRSVNVLAIFTLACSLSIGLMACLDKGDQGPAGPTGPTGSEGPGGAANVTVMGEISLDSTTASTGRVHVWVSNAPSVSTVTVNGTSIPLTGFAGTAWAYFLEQVSISAGATANLVVSYSRADGSTGTAQASVTLPGTFLMVSPPDGVTDVAIPNGSGLAVSWTPSAGVTRYSVQMEWDLDYYDSGATQTKYFDNSRELLITDTSVGFTAAVFWPSDFFSAIQGYGELHVAAVAGPVSEGQPGNVTGDGSGFFVGVTRAVESIELRHQSP